MITGECDDAYPPERTLTSPRIPRTISNLHPQPPRRTGRHMLPGLIQDPAPATVRELDEEFDPVRRVGGEDGESALDDGDCFLLSIGGR